MTLKKLKNEKKKKRKEENQKNKEIKKKEFLKKYGKLIFNINKFLSTSPLKNLIYILREEKNLKNWIKIYRKTFKGEKEQSFYFEYIQNRVGSRGGRGTIEIDKVRMEPPKYVNSFGDEISVTVYQQVNAKNYNVDESKYNVKFIYEVFWNDKFEEDKGNKIRNLNTHDKLSFEEMKKLLERFKYYMSDKYKKDWEFENELDKYNL